ncbi:MAG: DegT/DnrJ/EryC1/StrS family aminotransferase, partial [Candidatus Aureabacteria bacterium]|nr:DegT/DnrJ/EryC1/StrS family aminotransferase [Candidatus Auribacterota bacterium]
MRIPFLDLTLQHRSLLHEINRSIKKIFQSSAFLGGAETETFKKLFSQVTGARYTIPCSNGTSALYIALKACGITPGNEVITVPNTFIATAEALSLAGARIKLVDIDEKTHTIDIQKLKKALSSRTRCILPVFLYGLPCDMEKVMSLARKYRCRVVADACQAHGALFPYRGKRKKAGTVAEMSAFSFYPGKNLGAAGDAGAVSTDDPKLAETALMIANHGIRKNRYYHNSEGFNFRMDNLQSAILNIKIPLLQKWNARRREIAGLYIKSFKKAGIPVPLCPKGYTHVYHLFVIRVRNRDDLQKKLLEQGIQTGIHYPVPIHLQKAYAYLGYRKGSFPVSERLSREVVSLPIYPEMTDAQVAYVIKQVI